KSPKAPAAPPSASGEPAAPAAPAAPEAPAAPAEPADTTGHDDADVADFDAAAGMAEDPQGTTSTASSFTSYGRLDLGRSQPQAFVLVDGDST
ncbi:transmembrane BlaR protein, partial [Stenotrophomonas sp. SG1]|nr:transmembrane BlaR protein [Stenotrophomonas sp. SG1]